MTSSDATTLVRDGRSPDVTPPSQSPPPVPSSARPTAGASSAPAEAARDTRDLLARFRQKHQREAVRVSSPLSRDRILDATEACLREQGYDGTTIRSIAGRLECAVGTIYRHFKDKRALLDAVTQRRFECVAERVEQRARIQETAALYLRTASEEPQQYRLMFWLASVGSREMPGLPEVIRRILRGWGEQLEDHGRAERFWAQLHGALMLGRNPRPDLIQADALPAAPTPEAPAETAEPEDMTLL